MAVGMKHKEGRVLFSCHFTTATSPSEPPEQESRARGKVSPRLEWLVDGGSEVGGWVHRGWCVRVEGGGPLCIP